LVIFVGMAKLDSITSWCERMEGWSCLHRILVTGCIIFLEF
jgi:hypothetical protein